MQRTAVAVCAGLFSLIVNSRLSRLSSCSTLTTLAGLLKGRTVNTSSSTATSAPFAAASLKPSSLTCSTSGAIMPVWACCGLRIIALGPLTCCHKTRSATPFTWPSTSTIKLASLNKGTPALTPSSLPVGFWGLLILSPCPACWRFCASRAAACSGVRAAFD